MAKNKPVASKPSNTLNVDAVADVDCAALIAQTVLRPSVQAAATLQQFKLITGDVELGALVEELQDQAKLASSGDLERAEAMLVTQAHTLDAIFHNLARRAALNAGEYLGACETYMRLALKAQSQCRATLETLAVMKNPAPVAFVRQANIAHGPQQVNNAPSPAPESSRARESENQPNKLLEQRSDWMDTGATQATISTDSALEPVGEVHRAANAGR